MRREPIPSYQTGPLHAGWLSPQRISISHLGVSGAETWSLLLCFHSGVLEMTKPPWAHPRHMAQSIQSISLVPQLPAGKEPTLA